MVVREYQEGNLGYKLLAKKHGMKVKVTVERWVKLYEKFGTEGLINKEIRKLILFNSSWMY